MLVDIRLRFGCIVIESNPNKNSLRISKVASEGSHIDITENELVALVKYLPRCIKERHLPEEKV